MRDGMQMTPKKVNAAIISAMWFSIEDILVNSNECADANAEVEGEGKQSESKENGGCDDAAVRHGR